MIVYEKDKTISSKFNITRIRPVDLSLPNCRRAYGVELFTIISCML